MMNLDLKKICVLTNAKGIPMFLSKVSKNVQCQNTINLTFSDLARFITENDWSPALFKENYRLKANFYSSCIVGLDIDNGEGTAVNRCPTVEEAIEVFRDYKHIIATTKSHRKLKNGIVCDRYRVLLFLQDTVTEAKVYEQILDSLIHKFPFVDANCRDASRYFYKSTSVISSNENGRNVNTVDVSTTMNLGSKKKNTKQNNFSSFIENGALPGNWNNSLLKASIAAKQLGLSIEEAIEEFNSMKNPHFDGVLDEKDLATINSAYKYEVNPLFPKTYLDSSGSQKVAYEHPENMKFLILEFLGLNVRFNELKLHIEVNGKKLDDSILSIIRNEARRHRLKANGSFIEDCLNEMSMTDKYHPFKELVESNSWNGSDHIEQFFTLLNIAKDDLNYELYLKWFRKWLIGVIAKVYKPGSQNLMLTLKGAQGIGKDRWLRTLCLEKTEFYKEGFLDPSNKDHRLSQLTHIFWNVSELDGTTNKREAAELKSFLTASTVSERKAYGKFESSGYSVISFCASVNEDCFLGDQTGNRRFLVLPINFNINMDLEVDIQQIYAQAKNLYDQGVSPYFSLEEISETNSINDEYVHQDKIDEIAAAIVSGETPMTANQIFESFFYHSFNKKSDASKLGRLLKKKGISSSRPLVGGIKLTVYKVNKEKLSFD